MGRRHEWWSQLVCAASFEGCTAGRRKARGYLVGGKIQQNWHLNLKRFSWLTLIDRNGCGLCLEPCLDINYLATRVRRNPWIVTPWILLRELGFFESPLLCLESPKKRNIQVFSPENNVAVFSLSNLPDFFWLRLRPEISRTQNCHLKVTFSSTCWRSLSHPKKVTRNCQGVTFSKAHHFGYPTGFCCIRWWQIALHLLHCCRIRKCLREKKRLFVFFWTRDWDVRKFRVFFVFFKDDLMCFKHLSFWSIYVEFQGKWYFLSTTGWF